MSVPFAESDIEEASLEWLAELGYSVRGGQEITPDSRTPERTSYGDVTLSGRLARIIHGMGIHTSKLVWNQSVSGTV